LPSEAIQHNKRSIGENIDLRENDYPPIEPRGNSAAKSSMGRLIIGNNKVTSGENLIICGGEEADGGTFTMTGGEISGNTASASKNAYGGGVHVCIQQRHVYQAIGRYYLRVGC
jgi:hypothetical protein